MKSRVPRYSTQLQYLLYCGTGWAYSRVPQYSFVLTPSYSIRTVLWHGVSLKYVGGKQGLMAASADKRWG